MKLRKSLLLTAVIAAFVLPVGSYAQDASKSKTREEVKTELDAAHKGGTHEMGNDVSTVKPAPATAGKSRKQVKNELVNISEEEKAKLKEINLGAK